MRVRKPSIVIDGTEFQCKSNQMPNFEYDEASGTFCSPQTTVTVQVYLDYGTGGSYTKLKSIENTVVTCVLKPDDGTVSVDNPSQTFTARIPFIPPMRQAGIGERQPLDLPLTVEDVVTEATS